MSNKYYFPIILSFLVGFSSLSIEVLWVRLVSFSFHTIPQAFSYVLIVFLFGIAAGAFIGKLFCKIEKYDLYSISSIVLVISSFIDISSLHLINIEHKYFHFFLITILIFSTAFFKSIVFPIAHHLGSMGSNSIATSVSYVYFGNIFGSTLGPLVTTFIFLAYITTAQAFYVIGLITLAAAISSFVYSESKAIVLKYSVMPVVATVIAITVLPNENLWYRLFANGWLYLENPERSFKSTIESHYGVINTEHSLDGDIVYGFGVYDGRINTSLAVNSNLINRAYRIAGFHPQPKRVLIIGLSTGSWANVISWLPDVEYIDIVEIDPGYVELVRQYPEVSGVLDDNKVTIHIDDGRRWLNRHPENKYDLIVMNTSFHYRNNVTNLLSREFLYLIKKRLNSGGVFYFNTTDSPEVFHTATKVFGRAFRYINFVVASDSQLSLSREQALDRLSRMKKDDKYIFDLGGNDSVYINEMLDIPLITFDEYKKTVGREIEVITDNNPLTEYKYGYLMSRLKGER